MANGDLVKLGTLYVNGIMRARPTRPWYQGTTPPGLSGSGNIHNGGSNVEVRDTQSDEAYQIYWREVHTGDKTLLVCDRNICCNTSWTQLNQQGLVFGKEITIDGTRYKIRCLTGGNGEKGGPPDEWTNIICNGLGLKGLPIPAEADFNPNGATGAHNQFWNWVYMYSWCQETYVNNPDDRIIRGDGSANGWDYALAGHAATTYGWRPVLEVLNVPPSKPPHINVPDKVQSNKPVTITWGASTDPDGDAVTYDLEHSINGGSYAPAYSGAATTATETAGADWDTVQYRVRAVDSSGATDGYVTSTTRVVLHNADPTISGADADIGTVTAPPSYSYQIGDVDAADTLTVVEQLDGQTVRTISNAVRGTQYTFTLSREQYYALSDGMHSMSVTVTDNKGGSATRSVTFTRAVAGIDFDVNPRVTDVRPEKIMVTMRCVAADADISIQVCNNALDASPTWEPAAANVKHIFTNTVKAAEKWAVSARIRISKSAGYEQIICYQPSIAYK